jgi:hypothetical protein
MRITLRIEAETPIAITVETYDDQREDIEPMPRSSRCSRRRASRAPAEETHEPGGRESQGRSPDTTLSRPTRGKAAGEKWPGCWLLSEGRREAGRRLAAKRAEKIAEAKSDLSAGQQHDFHRSKPREEPVI